MRLAELKRALVAMGEDGRGSGTELKRRYQKALLEQSSQAAMSVSSREPRVTFEGMAEAAQRRSQQASTAGSLSDLSTIALCGSVGHFASLHATFEHMAIQNSGERVIASAGETSKLSRESVPISESASAFVQHRVVDPGAHLHAVCGQPWQVELSTAHIGKVDHFLVHLVIRDDGVNGTAQQSDTLPVCTSSNGTTARFVPARCVRWGADLPDRMLKGSPPQCQWLRKGGGDCRPKISTSHTALSGRHAISHPGPRYTYSDLEHGEWRSFGTYDNYRMARASQYHEPPSRPNLSGRIALTFGNKSAAHQDAVEAERLGAIALLHLCSTGHAVSRSGVAEDHRGGEEDIMPLDSWVDIPVIEVHGQVALRLHEFACRAPHLLRIHISKPTLTARCYDRKAMASAALDVASSPTPVMARAATASRSPTKRPAPCLPDGASNWLVAVPMLDEPTPRPATDRLRYSPTIFADGRPALPKSRPVPKCVWVYDELSSSQQWHHCDPTEFQQRELQHKKAQWQLDTPLKQRMKPHQAAAWVKLARSQETRPGGT
eukprot:scaffold175856_cov31-Tisochrysis_lutea.AAC.1